MTETIVGVGRIGRALAEMGPAALVRRGEAVPDGEGPVYVCTRNDDLDVVLRQTPRSRRGDLVFVQNGMLRPWLERHGLADNTQALLYFAVSTRGATPVDGGGTVAWGPWADALVARLARGGIAAQAVDRETFDRQMVEKLLWNCVFGLICQARGVTVGQAVDDHRAEVDALTAELAGVAEEALELTLAPGVSERLCAYSRTIADYTGAVKEWRWRNGWFRGRARTPVHEGLLAMISI
ncbi:MAG: hypothetical protein H6739_00775 [Alphaproteobacteria bacterium]|nr:hypothetical protein [Alphaproteobacteria bacterium]